MIICLELVLFRFIRILWRHKSDIPFCFGKLFRLRENPRRSTYSRGENGNESVEIKGRDRGTGEDSGKRRYRRRGKRQGDRDTKGREEKRAAKERGRGGSGGGREKDIG
jgi:hypothetical protein